MKRILMIAVACLMSLPGLGQNIDLSTLPKRDTVQLTIYNNEDLTLVRETRVLTLKRGENRLQFSWANTLIDPTSVELQFKSDPERLSLVDTVFPHEKRQMLFWNIESEIEGPATLEISYFTSGVSWSADYAMIASADESTANVTGYVTVINNSGEDYEDAEVRLVVGHINLVEKIKELAQRGVIPAFSLQDALSDRSVRSRAQREMLTEAEGFGLAVPVPSAPAAEAPKQIVKKGLSEYFIFTVEGRETVKNGWSKRMKSFKTDSAPIEVVYRYRPRQYGDRLVKLFLLKNDEDAELGKSPLPDGVFRVFRKQSSEPGSVSLSYVGQQTVPYIPIGEEAELVLGVDPEVTFETVALRAWRSRIMARIRGVRVLERIDEPGGIRLLKRSTVEGYDQHITFEQRVRNNTGKPIKVEVRRPTSGDVLFISELKPTKHDANTAAYETTVEPGVVQNVRYETVTRSGVNHGSNRVELREGVPRPPVWEEMGE